MPVADWSASCHHSSAEVVCATSRKLAGTPLDQIHPHLKGFTNLKFENLAIGCERADVAFLAVPHTAAMSIAGKLLSRGIKVVDLMADYRLRKETLEKVYVSPTRIIYRTLRIPELHRKECVNAKFVANPGCFPPLPPSPRPPLPSSKYGDLRLKDGVSGAGETRRRPRTTPTSATMSALQMDQPPPSRRDETGTLKARFNGETLLHAPPCPGQPWHPYHRPYPLKRAYGNTEEVERNCTGDFYKDEFFVRYQKPMLSAFRGSNFCNLMVESEGLRVVVASAIDNLSQGRSGQAIQNMNIMCGFKETDGLVADRAAAITE